MSKPKIVVPQGISGDKERSRRPALDAIERRASNWTHKVRSKALNRRIALSKIDSDFPADAMESAILSFALGLALDVFSGKSWIAKLAVVLQVLVVTVAFAAMIRFL